jgi:methionine-rich copper-binding protein CopC
MSGPAGRRLGPALAVVAGIALAGAGGAAAHSDVEATTPRAGAALAAPPAAVSVVYGTPLARVDRVRVTIDGRAVPATGRLSPADARRLVIRPRHPGEGAYALSWTVTGADGHALEGSLAFRVRAHPIAREARRVGASLARAAAALQRAAAAAQAPG